MKTDRGATDAASLAPPLVALCGGAVAMGVSPLFVRFVSGEIGPFASAFWRVALALPILFAWSVAEGGSIRASFRIDRASALAGLVFSGDLFFWHLAILATTVANATFFATTAPVFVVVITAAVLRDRVPGATLAGLLLCLAGGGALIGQSLQVAPERLRGDLFGGATAFFFALYFLAVSAARRGRGAGTVTFRLSLVTAAVLLVVALILEPGRLLPHTPGAWASLLALGIVSHAGGQGLLSVALGRLPAVFSSLVIFLEAVVAALAGWLVLGEGLGLVQAAGGAAILGGIWIARPRRGTAGRSSIA